MEKLFPFWRYRIGNSKKHRPEHEAWNGLVLSADDPWWDTHYPPNGWGCNCYVQALDEVDLRELGKKGPDPAPEGGSRRVQYGNRLIDVPNGIDAGWAYAPGREGYQAQMNVLAKADPHVAVQAWEKDVKSGALERLNADWNEALDKLLESRVPKEILDQAHIVRDSSQAGSELAREDFKNWAKPLIDAGRGFNISDIPSEAKLMGFMNKIMLDGLEGNGFAPLSAGFNLDITDVDPGHSQRPGKKDRGAAIVIEDFYDLPNLLADESLQRAILLDIRKPIPELLVVFDARGQKYNSRHKAEMLKGKFVIQVGVDVSFLKDGQITRRILNRIRTAGLVPYHNLIDENVYKRLKWTYKAKI
jgi:hypothetical protein